MPVSLTSVSLTDLKFPLRPSTPGRDGAVDPVRNFGEVGDDDRVTPLRVRRKFLGEEVQISNGFK